MAHEQFDDAVPLYVVGAMERQERQAFEAHLLTGCAVCHAALKEYRPVAGLLPYGLPPVAAPPKLKSRVMAAINHGPSEDVAKAPQKARLSPDHCGARLSWPSLSWSHHPAFALLLLLALAGTGVYALSIQSQVSTEVAQRQRLESALRDETARLAALRQQVAEQERVLNGLRDEFNRKADNLGELRNTLVTREAELDQLRADLAKREQELGGLRRALGQRDEMLTFLRSPRVKVISLAGLEQAKSAGALLLFDPDTKKAFFFAFNMPPLPPGKTYQLWAIVDKPISAGTFTTDAGQKSRLIIRSIPDLARITKFAVSIEPEGGRPQPTGDVYLVGQL